MVRQYLAYGFDQANKADILTSLPRSGKQLVDDMGRSDGVLPMTLNWMATNETQLRTDFLKRLAYDVQDDTRARFMNATGADLLRQRIHQAANAFDRTRKDLENARSRLQDQQGDEDFEDVEEVVRELRILRARLSALSRTSALEILTDHGLLPNYAFPERGVRFYGAVYNRHSQNKGDAQTIEEIRPAERAIKDLAPHNHYYTHRRQFEIQQIAVGNVKAPLKTRWAICGNCGHMRRATELKEAEAEPACPQCGHGGSQADVGQQHDFIEFADSQALSYMETLRQHVW